MVGAHGHYVGGSQRPHFLRSDRHHVMCFDIELPARLPESKRVPPECVADLALEVVGLLHERADRSPLDILAHPFLHLRARVLVLLVHGRESARGDVDSLGLQQVVDVFAKKPDNLVKIRP